MIVKNVSTDVLIVGDGIAGLRAALEAASRGAKVLVVSKIEPRKPNTSSVIGGWITHRDEHEIEELFYTLLEEGNFINDQDLAWTFAREVVYRVPELRKFGVELKIEVREEERVGAFRSIWRVVGPTGRLGEGLVGPLRRAAMDRGVQILRNAIVTRLLCSNGSVYGATVLDLSNQRLLAVHTKAVILATGGASCIYEKSDNPVGTTGDGYALALRAGAELIDMEFEIFSLSPRQLCHLFSDNLDEDKILRGPARAHYTCGGIRIGIDGETRVKGLYAAGEVTGGVFGSARLGGAAVADTIIFGYRAGKAAADYAKGIIKIPLLEEQVRVEEKRLENILRSRGNSPSKLISELKKIMWQRAGVIRKEKYLVEGLKEIRELREELENIAVGTFSNLREAIEIDFMIEVAETMCLSALTRKESRGAHWRIDYPKPDKDWLKNIIIRREKSQLNLEVRPVELKRAKPKGPFKIGDRHTWCYIITS